MSLENPAVSPGYDNDGQKGGRHNPPFILRFDRLIIVRRDLEELMTLPPGT